jgi:hypothetical protein
VQERVTKSEAVLNQIRQNNRRGTRGSIINALTGMKKLRTNSLFCNSTKWNTSIDQSVLRSNNPLGSGAEASGHSNPKAGKDGSGKSAGDGPAKAVMGETASQNVLLYAQAFNVISAVLFTINAMAVMLVGVGVKLSITDPTASPDSFFALEQRLELGVPCAVVFSIQLTSTLLRNRHHYACYEAVCAHLAHMGTLFARLVMIATAIAACFAPLQPVAHLALQAVIAVVQCALLHTMEHRLIIESDRTPVMARIPDALHSLRLKAQRYRTMATGGAHKDEPSRHTVFAAAKAATKWRHTMTKNSTRDSNCRNTDPIPPSRQPIGGGHNSAAECRHTIAHARF